MTVNSEREKETERQDEREEWRELTHQMKGDQFPSTPSLSLFLLLLSCSLGIIIHTQNELHNQPRSHVPVRKPKNNIICIPLDVMLLKSTSMRADTERTSLHLLLNQDAV